MRHFSFRIWDKHNKKLFSHEEILNMKFCVVFGEETRETPLYQFLLQYQESDPQTNYVIQQFTGLTDKTGKPIYEGDLVNFTTPQITHGPEREDYFGEEVIFDDEIASFAFGTNSMTMLDRIDPKSLEVVGNALER